MNCYLIWEQVWHSQKRLGLLFQHLFNKNKNKYSGVLGKTIIFWSVIKLIPFNRLAGGGVGGGGLVVNL